MKGLIMDYPLTLTHFFERTRKVFHRKTLATRVPGAGLQRYTYADYADRKVQLFDGRVVDENTLIDLSSRRAAKV